jgi:hypothetical protein
MLLKLEADGAQISLKTFKIEAIGQGARAMTSSVRASDFALQLQIHRCWHVKLLRSLEVGQGAERPNCIGSGLAHPPKSRAPYLTNLKGT